MVEQKPQAEDYFVQFQKHNSRMGVGIKLQASLSM